MSLANTDFLNTLAHSFIRIDVKLFQINHIRNMMAKCLIFVVLKTVLGTRASEREERPFIPRTNPEFKQKSLVDTHTRIMLHKSQSTYLRYHIPPDSPPSP